MADAPPEPEDDAPGVPEWVVTYGDMMSLLLTFFIMLVSMSELKQEGKMRAMLDALHERFGPTSGTFGVPGRSKQERSKREFVSSTGSKSSGGTESSNQATAGRGGPNLTVERLSHNSVITLGGPAHFERFSAEITQELRSRAARVGELLLRTNFMIVIRGHASPEPLPDDSEYADPMALSWARAEAIAEVMIEAGVEPERLIVSAAGDSEPRTRSRQVEDQVWNRRVDIFLADSYITPRAKLPSADVTPTTEPVTPRIE